MNDINKILTLLQKGQISTENAAKAIEELFFIAKDEFHLDTNRKKRLGFDEVIYGLNKTEKQLSSIFNTYLKKKLNFFCTGLNQNKINILKRDFPYLFFDEKSGTARNFDYPSVRFSETVGIITAGTSDAKVAYEARETLKISGIESELYIDVGVAGIHRFLKYGKDILQHRVLIVIAGMEGALPSVVGGLFPQPIIAVPTSVGYGTALNGFTPLFAMLTSCANGITVVNIDNGFGAAMAAFRIINRGQN